MTRNSNFSSARPFTYQDQSLYCEEVSLKEIARQVGTPVYAYSAGAIRSAFGEFEKGLKGTDALVCYAVKANSNIHILKELVSLGAGLDVVSGGELFRAEL